ncbi:MAG: hypothetical protein ACP5PZ_04665 [Bacteroidales bacterium]
MKKIKFFVFGSMLLMATSQAFSQNHAIGLRFSEDLGITYKQNVKGSTWFEIIGHIREHSLGVTGLYEAYQPTPFSKYFKWYYGGGAFVGLGSVNDNSYTFAGLRGVLGLCYNFSDIPFDISLDWMPTVQLVEDYGTDFLLFGISIRYTF